MENLKERFKRVDKKGTSSNIDESLEDDVIIFLKNNNIKIEDFINKYLKIKSD